MRDSTHIQDDKNGHVLPCRTCEGDRFLELYFFTVFYFFLCLDCFHLRNGRGAATVVFVV